jgi:hypothetical protein
MASWLAETVGALLTKPYRKIEQYPELFYT